MLPDPATLDPGTRDETGGMAANTRWTPWRNLLTNLACGVRLSLLRRAPPEELAAAFGDLVLLALLDLVLNLGVSILLVGNKGEFSTSALTSFFFHLPPMLLLGHLAGRRLGRPLLTTAVPVALISLSVTLELCHAALEGMAQLPRLGWLMDYLSAPHYYRFFWWWTAASSLFLGRLAPASPLRRLAVLFLFVVLLAAPLWFFPRGDLWVRAPSSSEGGELHLTEEVLSAQARLLDEQLAGLLPGSKGGASLYFVGFAGDAGQDVFTRELGSVSRLFATRFGAAGRSVSLANHPRTAGSLPFATATNLERTLERIGRVMNRDEDVLFLYLTSHGAKEEGLVVDNPPLELDSLTPETLRRMLEESGITWRVIVVSSCYAGEFIGPLKDDHTLIITAADATHESFGCSYGERFTWFGKAYYDEALRRTHSFTEAFAQARETIGQWEKREGETPSNPQIWIGRAMEQKLGSLESRLRSGGGKR